ncbi:MAG: NAD(P)/FAD-dependent oxidoreductase [Desulfatiglandaceae bacterium]
MKAFDLAIIGAGPAGISAAIEAAALGASVALIEENPVPGGKVFGHMNDHLKDAMPDRFEKRIGSQLLQRLDSVMDRVSVFLESEVWTVWDQWIVAIHQKGTSGDQVRSIRAGKLIISIGAFERIVPFQGWTLPGIFSVGGLNSLTKRGIVPGEKILITGSGPLQLVLAHHLINAGAGIIGMVNAASPQDIAARGLQLLSNMNGSVLASGVNHLFAIKRQRIPTYFSHAISMADGSHQVERVVIVRVDRTGRPIKGTEREIVTDCVAYGYGLIPSCEVTRLCGCNHIFDDQLGYWKVQLSEKMETSKAGVFVAGDCRLVKGYSAAIEEGKIAAVEACVQLGYTNRKTADSMLRASRRRLRRFKRFARAMECISRPGPGLLDIISDDTVICRCEEVTMKDIRSAVAEGAGDVNDIKRRTRLGMGHCQGRFCGQVINELIWKMTGIPQKREIFTARIPVKPVPFGVLAKV